jgi:hypothetical protein
MEQHAVLEWSSPEYDHQPKSLVWYIGFGTATVIIVGTFALFGNYFAAGVLALLCGLLFYISRQAPALVRYRLLGTGVAINNVLYQYQNLLAFNVIYEPDGSKIVIIQSNKRFMPLLYLEVGEADPVAIREALLQFVPENQDLAEPLTDIVIRKLGF